MSLEDEIKNMKAQLAEENKKAEEEGEEQEVEAQPNEKEDTHEGAQEDADKSDDSDKKEKEPAKEPEEEKPAEEEKADASAYARMRREAAAAKKLAAEEVAKREEEASQRKAIEEELRALKSKLSDAGDAAARPQEKEIEYDPEIEEIKRERLLTKAEREFKTLEDDFRRKTPEYDAVAQEYTMALAQSIKLQNPRMSNSSLYEELKKSILLKASNYMKEGFDPIEEMYHEARDLGFTGKSVKKEDAQEKEESTEEDIKPDMKKLSKNRAKSTGMTASSGKSNGSMTKDAAAKLSIAEWHKLSAMEKKRLMYG